MMYHRGHAADYEDWIKAGATGWSWEENKKYFDMNEGNKQVGTLVNVSYHSSNGTLPVQQVRSNNKINYVKKFFVILSVSSTITKILNNILPTLVFKNMLYKVL